MDKALDSMTRSFMPRTDITPMPRALFGQATFERVAQHVITDGRWNNHPDELTPERIRRGVTAHMMGSR